MEHSLHLAAKHFVQSIAPHWSKNTSGVNNEDCASSAGEDDEDDIIEAGDLLGKAITLVKQASCFLFTRYPY